MFLLNKNYYYNLFITIQILIYIFYILAYFNWWNEADYWRNLLHYILQTITGLILFIIFNPYIFTKYNSFHLYVAFTAGTMLLTSSFLQLFSNSSIINDFINKIIYRYKILNYYLYK